MSVTTSPTALVAGTALTVSSDAGGNIAIDTTVVELTSVPSSSALSTGYVLVNADTGATSAQQAAASLNSTNTFTPDVAGEYALKVYLFQRLPSTGTPGIDSVDRWILRANESATLNVGGYADLPIVTRRGDGATLRLTVAGSTVTAASLVSHTTEVARVAALQTDVTDALTAIESTAVATALGVTQTRITDLRDEFEDHIASATWHVAADTANGPTLSQPTTQDAALAVLNELSDIIPAHVNSLTYHTNGDGAAVPIVGTATTLAEATVLLADLRERCFERHRVRDTASTPPIHDNSGGDTTNALTTPTLLDDIIVAYLDALVAADPSVAAGESEGLIDAAHMAGFTIVT